MKQLFLAILLALSMQIFAQIGINNDASAPDASAMLDVKASDKGLLLPRLTTAQRNTIASPATGLLVFDTDDGSFYFYSGTEWQNLSQGGQWTNSGGNVSLSDNTLNVGIGTSTPSGKLMIQADANHVSTAPIFEVQNKNGQAIFTVFDGWVEIYGNDNATGKTGEKGGLEVAGYDNTKGITRKYFTVSDDSVRFYIADGSVKTGEKGGLEVAGYDNTKAVRRSYLRVTTDSTVISFDQSAAKTGEKGGLEVAAYDNAKSTGNIELLRVTPDSTSVQDLTGQSSFILPRYTHQEIQLLENVPAGSVVFDKDSASFAVYSGTNWIESDGDTFAAIVDVDGNRYSSIRLGTQQWLVQNLKTTKYNDGTAIPFVTGSAAWVSTSTQAYCWYNDDIANKNLGAMYNWFVVNAASNGNKNVCPSGWHVPSDAEWTVLTTYLTNNGYGYQGSGSDIAKSMAAKSVWTTSATAGQTGNDQSTNNSSGLSLYPVGSRSYLTGLFEEYGERSYNWTTDVNALPDCWRFAIAYNSANANRNAFNNKRAASIRCVKD